jgi:hypothetical protein
MAKARNKNNAKHGSSVRAVDEVRTKLASPGEFIPCDWSIAQKERSEVRNRGSEKESR